MDNKLPNVNKDKPVWRCVDWSTNKANERFLKGKNRYDPYIYDFALATNGVYMPDEQLVLDGTDKRPCVFRGLGKSPHIHECIKQNIDYMYIDTGYFGNDRTKKWHRVAYNNLQTLDHVPMIDIEQRLLDAYERIRSNSRNGLAVVTVERNACGGCFNRVTPQQVLEVQNRKKIIACEHCGRIFIPSEDTEGK